MSDLISRKALQNEFAYKCRGVCDMCQYDMYGLCNLIKDAPTVEAKEVVHGKWIVGSKPRCSVCGKSALRENDREAWLSYVPSDFCPHCGADMRTSAE